MKDDGFSVNEELNNVLKNTGTTRGEKSIWGVYTYGSALDSEDPISVYTDEVKATWVNNYNDAAIVMFARQGGEHEDMNMYDMHAYTDQERDYDYRNSTRDGRQSSIALIPQEKDLLGMLKEEKSAGRLKKIIVLLNTSSQMEVDWLDEYDVDACMFVGALGAQGARGISSILSGDTNPSGHLVDTYAVDSRSAPACVNSLENTPTYTNYEEIEEYTQENTQDQWVNKGSGAYLSFQAESIYIGYKYYETRYEDSVFGVGNASSAKGASRGASEWSYENEVVYPFGYGLSYTMFDQTLGDVRYDPDTDTYKVEVTVTNTGNVAGKSVVQVYAQTPYGDYEKANKVEKSAVQLVGFGKTDNLDPGEPQTLTVDVDRYLLASYDYVGAKGYILSEGTYYLAIGDNAHDALNNIIRAKDEDITGLVAVGGGEEIVYMTRSNWSGTYPTPKQLTINADLAEALDYDRPVEEDPEATMPEYGKSNGMSLIMLRDLPYNDPAWGDLLDQMTFDEQANMLASSFRTTQAVQSINKPATRENDGPMGIRSAHSNGMWSTTFPCAPIIAATFNTDLIRRVGDGKGEDILHSGHRVLYTVLHSNAMNGVTSNIEIHKIVTWWQHLITVLIVVLAVLTAVFVGLTAQSVARRILRSRKTEN